MASLACLETQSLRSHALCLFIKCVDPVVKLCAFRLFCITATQFIESPFYGQFVDFSHNYGKSFSLDNLLFAAPDKAASPSWEDGSGREAASSKARQPVRVAPAQR